MGKSKIEWCTDTWNPTTGCSRVSAGCDNCYAIRMANRQKSAAYEGTVRKRSSGKLDWSGLVNFNYDRLDQPIRWRRPRRIFVDSMSDLFHPAIPGEYIDRVWAVMAIAHWHQYLILTKRPERMATYLQERTIRLDLIQQKVNWMINQRPTPEDAGLWEMPLKNVWLGTSIENQAAVTERLPYLMICPAAIRFVSCEPLLEPISLRSWLPMFSSIPGTLGKGIDQVIVGGESGPGARPMEEEWAIDLLEQCIEARIAFFFKQGSSNNWPSYKDFDSFPADLQVRQYPHEDTVDMINPQKCRVCGCTGDYCVDCVQRTGIPCHWIEHDLCSACI